MLIETTAKKGSDVMFALYETVKIIRSGDTGTIIDIGPDAEGRTMYTVESDRKTSDEYGTLYPLAYCREDELSLLDETA